MTKKLNTFLIIYLKPFLFISKIQAKATLKRFNRFSKISKNIIFLLIWKYTVFTKISLDSWTILYQSRNQNIKQKNSGKSKPRMNSSQYKILKIWISAKLSKNCPSLEIWVKKIIKKSALFRNIKFIAKNIRIWKIFTF